MTALAAAIRFSSLAFAIVATVRGSIALVQHTAADVVAADTFRYEGITFQALVFAHVQVEAFWGVAHDTDIIRFSLRKSREDYTKGTTAARRATRP